MRRAVNRPHDATQGLVPDSCVEGSPTQSAPTQDLRCVDCCGRWLDLTPPQSPKEPAGIALGAGSAGEACHRKKPEGGRPGRPTVFARQDVESETAGGAPTRPVGQ